MSTVTPQRTALVPTPRTPVDAERPQQTAPEVSEEAVGLYGRHAWLVPVTGIACVVAVFVAMVVLTWAAGGGTPFDR